MRSLAFGKAMKPVALDKKPQPELQALARSQGLRITGTAAAKLQAGSLFQFYINGAISQSRQGQPFGALLLTIIKGVTIINSSGGGAPDEKPCFWESYEASGFGQEATGSGIRELQALARSQGLRITGTAAAKLQAGSLFQFYINGAISQSRQGQPLWSPAFDNNKGGDNNKLIRGRGSR